MRGPDSEGETRLLFRRAGNLPDRGGLKRLHETLSSEVAGGRGFGCLITDDRELKRLNRTFLGNDYATDVLSFPSGNREGFLGEIAISADRAREQAREHGHRVDVEIGILMLHGLLHLTGMDHARDRGRMRRAETQWRKRLGLPAGLIERTAR